MATAMTALPFVGIPVVETELAVHRRQVRFPRTRKRRIQKKWRKDVRNWTNTPCSYLVTGIGLVCHPLIAAQIRAAVLREEERYAEKWR
jgi:hypothetical protein